MHSGTHALCGHIQTQTSSSHSLTTLELLFPFSPDKKSDIFGCTHINKFKVLRIDTVTQTKNPEGWKKRERDHKLTHTHTKLNWTHACLIRKRCGRFVVEMKLIVDLVNPWIELWLKLALGDPLQPSKSWVDRYELNQIYVVQSGNDTRINYSLLKLIHILLCKIKNDATCEVIHAWNSYVCKLPPEHIFTLKSSIETSQKYLIE